MKGIPSEEDVERAVRKVLNSVQRAESQHELGELVRKELAKSDPDVRISDSRIRRIAASTGAARLEIEYRDASGRELPDLCPVCGNAMSPVKNSTLDGGVAEFKRVCTVCPYSVGLRSRAAARYVFVRAPERETPEEVLRVRKLKAAASHLRKAKKLIAEALEGTDFPERKEWSEKAIDEIVNSKERAGSIPSLIADVRDIGHEDPLWTKPLDTPKYPARK